MSYLALGAESVPHQIYEVLVQTTPMDIDKESEVLSNLYYLAVPGMSVIAVETKGQAGEVRIQVTGSPFVWELFLPLLPSLIGPIILMVVGIILILRIPDWAWAAIPLGAGGALLMYAYYKSRK